MTLSFIRCFFMLISCAVGYYIGVIVDAPLMGTQIGALSGLLLIFLESRLKRVSVRGLSSMVFGLLLGVFMAKLISDIITLLPLGDFILSVSRVVLTLVFSYLGAVMALRGKDEFNIIIPYVRFRRQEISDDVTLLDTSAIIDGRVSDVYKANFLSGILVVPRFILQELQALADSADDLKRQKGRRGFELLQMMQKDSRIEINIHEDEIVEELEVDSRLVKLAKIMDARICTTDFNLGRMAALQGVKILNIHELGNALKLVVSAGDEFDVDLVKEGKEKGQAIGYLPDGTMVVVTGGRDFIGQTSNIKVSSILHTQAGKMIFAKIV